MKALKLLLALCLFSSSIIVNNLYASSSENTSTLRVRTVPKSTEQKKKEDSKTNSTKQSSVTPCTTVKASSQKLFSSLYIGNGGVPK